MNRRFTDPKVIDNDAIVVLSLEPYTCSTHHDFKVRAKALGFDLTKSDCHNMLHRATGRVQFNGSTWLLTTAGMVYRQHVIDTMKRIFRAMDANGDVDVFGDILDPPPRT